MWLFLLLLFIVLVAAVSFYVSRDTKKEESINDSKENSKENKKQKDRELEKKVTKDRVKSKTNSPKNKKIENLSINNPNNLEKKEVEDSNEELKDVFVREEGKKTTSEELGQGSKQKKYVDKKPIEKKVYRKNMGLDKPIADKNKDDLGETIPEDKEIKKIDLKNEYSLVGENGLLYQYCKENARLLYSHRILSIAKSIEYLKNNPEVSEKIIESVNQLDPERYEEMLDITISKLNNNPKSEKLKVLKDVLLSCVYFSGANKWRDSFLKRERVFSKKDKISFIDRIKDDNLKKYFEDLVTTSMSSSSSISSRAAVDINVKEILDKPRAISLLNESLTRENVERKEEGKGMR